MGWQAKSCPASLPSRTLVAPPLAFGGRLKTLHKIQRCIALCAFSLCCFRRIATILTEPLRASLPFSLALRARRFAAQEISPSEFGCLVLRG